MVDLSSATYTDKRSRMFYELVSTDIKRTIQIFAPTSQAEAVNFADFLAKKLKRNAPLINNTQFYPYRINYA
jgi:hypothetical protein